MPLPFAYLARMHTLDFVLCVIYTEICRIALSGRLSDLSDVCCKGLSDTLACRFSSAFSIVWGGGWILWGFTDLPVVLHACQVLPFVEICSVMPTSYLDSCRLLCLWALAVFKIIIDKG